MEGRTEHKIIKTSYRYQCDRLILILNPAALRQGGQCDRQAPHLVPINNWVDSNYSIFNTAHISVLLLQYGCKIKASHISILLSREIHIVLNDLISAYSKTLFMGVNIKTGYTI